MVEMCDVHMWITRCTDRKLLSELVTIIDARDKELNRPVPEDKLGQRLCDGDWVVHCGRVADGPFQIHFTPEGLLRGELNSGVHVFHPSVVIKTYHQHGTMFKRKDK